MILRRINWWKVLWFICGTICGLYAAYAAWRFNYANAKDLKDAVVLGAEYTTLTVGAISLPGWAFYRWRHRKNWRSGLLEGVCWMSCWVGMTFVILTNSAGFLAQGRNATSVAADNQLLDFNVAKAAYDKAKADLGVQQQHRAMQALGEGEEPRAPGVQQGSGKRCSIATVTGRAVAVRLADDTQNKP
jgi:hypothetical protein